MKRNYVGNISADDVFFLHQKIDKMLGFFIGMLVIVFFWLYQAKCLKDMDVKKNNFVTFVTIYFRNLVLCICCNIESTWYLGFTFNNTLSRGGNEAYLRD